MFGKGEIKRATVFLWGCLFFILGTLAASFLPEKLLAQDTAFFSLTLASLAFSLLGRRKKDRILCLLFFLLFFALWRYSFTIPRESLNKISSYNGYDSIFAGKIIKSQINDKGKQKIVVRTDKLLSSKNGLIKDIEAEGRVIMTLPKYPSLAIGQGLEIECRLEKPAAFDSFAYDRYLARYGIFSQCSFAKVKEVKTPVVIAPLESLRKWSKTKMKRSLGSDESGLALGVLLGDTSEMDSETKNNFSRSGLSHLVAVSGLNITILSVMLMNTFLGVGIGRKRSFWLSALVLGLYVLLVGMPASAVRAGLMGIIILWAAMIGRISRLDNLIFFSAALMLLFNPKLLRDDIGFQLSFLAMLSFAYLMPLFERMTDKMKIKDILGIRDNAFTSISATMFTWPLIAYNFKIVPLLSLPANILTGPLQSFYMILNIISLSLELISEKMAFVSFLVVGAISKYVLGVAGYLAAPDWAVITDFNINIFQLILYYGLLSGIMIILKKKIPKI